jgi:uncharacterized protein YraI
MRFPMYLLAATAALIAATSVPALADTADGVARSSGTLRAGPGTQYPAVDHISRGDDLEIYGCTIGYQWCDVSVDGNRGWFQGSRISYDEDGRQVIIQDVGPQIGIGILGFGAQDYFQQHYRDRPFYGQYRQFDRGRPGNGGQQGDRRPNDQQQRPNAGNRPNDAGRQPSNPDFRPNNTPNGAAHRQPPQEQRAPANAQRPQQQARPEPVVRPPAAQNQPARAPAPGPHAPAPGRGGNPDFNGAGCGGKECR